MWPPPRKTREDPMLTHGFGEWLSDEAISIIPDSQTTVSENF